RLLATRPGFQGRVVAMDFALPMLRLGSAKLRGERVAVAAADTQVLPAADETFDGAVIGFGVRNLASLEVGLTELTRVLKPGGRLVVLDFGMPKGGILRSLYLWYFQHVLPVIGRAVSGHPTAYSYLPESVVSFPDPPGLARALSQAGLRDTGYQLMLGGA